MSRRYHTYQYAKGRREKIQVSTCEKTFKKEDYRLKHMRLLHSHFECGVCNQTVKEGNQALHMMKCSKDKKTVTCKFKNNQI